MQYQLTPPPSNPLSRLLAAIVGAAALVAGLFFGFFILLAVLALGLVAWIVIWLRMWWIRRKLAASGTPPPGFGPPFADERRRAADSADAIDAEYEVVSKEEGGDEGK